MKDGLFFLKTCISLQHVKKKRNSELKWTWSLREHILLTSNVARTCYCLFLHQGFKQFEQDLVGHIYLLCVHRPYLIPPHQSTFKIFSITSTFKAWRWDDKTTATTCMKDFIIYYIYFCDKYWLLFFIWLFIPFVFLNLLKGWCSVLLAPRLR